MERTPGDALRGHGDVADSRSRAALKHHRWYADRAEAGATRATAESRTSRPANAAAATARYALTPCVLSERRTSAIGGESMYTNTVPTPEKRVVNCRVFFENVESRWLSSAGRCRSTFSATLKQLCSDVVQARFIYRIVFLKIIAPRRALSVASHRSRRSSSPVAKPALSGCVPAPAAYCSCSQRHEFSKGAKCALMAQRIRSWLANGGRSEIRCRATCSRLLYCGRPPVHRTHDPA